MGQLFDEDISNMLDEHIWQRVNDNCVANELFYRQVFGDYPDMTI